MTVESKSVFSSHVNTIAYDDQRKEMRVTWDTGKTSIYSGVPQHIADEVMNSWSVGKALHAAIKDKFPHRYAED